MRCNLVIGIPTAGRPAILRQTLKELARQTRLADRIIVCGAKPDDVEGVRDVSPDIKILLSEPGLPRQRNAIIDAAHDADVLVYFDDDFLPSVGYLNAIEEGMMANPGCGIATGHVLADGIGGPGLSPSVGLQVLTQTTKSCYTGGPPAGKQVFTGYGCNMAIRMATIRQHALRFDERLPLYGWQEDVDFSRRLAPFATVLKFDSAIGVHLGVKSGRASGLRLGYSQVANPLYLSGKGRGYPLKRALAHISRNVAMNLVRAICPESYVDRRGRLKGNLLALLDMARARMKPERVLDL